MQKRNFKHKAYPTNLALMTFRGHPLLMTLQGHPRSISKSQNETADMTSNNSKYTHICGLFMLFAENEI